MEKTDGKALFVHHLVVASAWALVGLAASGVLALAAKQQIKEGIQYAAVNFAAAEARMAHQLQASDALAEGLAALQAQDSRVMRAWLDEPDNEKALRAYLKTLDGDTRGRLVRLLQRP